MQQDDEFDATRHRAIPSGRAARLGVFGKLAGGVAGGMIAEGARRLAAGERPKVSDLILTPGNAARVADRLSHLRGAAMKLGQMVSMDAGDVLPAELSQILARLRNQAYRMPPAQLDQVLRQEWGADWRRRVRRFDAAPIAAASIGQVHRATLPDGGMLAIKVQYPGVADSIDADVDNVATLLRLSGVVPASIDLRPLLAEAKRQLAEEADYVREGQQMRHYRARLEGDPRFVVPQLHEPLTTRRVLAMSFEEGRPIEELATAPQAQRDAAMTALLTLVLRELFEFGVMQTDPNFANYRWRPESGEIVLLDFGAARPVPPETSNAYRTLLRAALTGDRDGLRAALIDVGFVSSALVIRHGAALDAMIDTIIAHVLRPGLFDFADRSFVARLREQATPVVADTASWHLPPVETMFVQRKVSGTALLAVRMQARLPLVDMVAGMVAKD